MLSKAGCLILFPCLCFHPSFPFSCFFYTCLLAQFPFAIFLQLFFLICPLYSEEPFSSFKSEVSGSHQALIRLHLFPEPFGKNSHFLTEVVSWSGLWLVTEVKQTMQLLPCLANPLLLNASVPALMSHIPQRHHRPMLMAQELQTPWNSLKFF